MGHYSNGRLQALPTDLEIGRANSNKHTSLQHDEVNYDHKKFDEVDPG